MIKVYIAFSIHGTNQFIIAKNEVDGVVATFLNNGNGWQPRDSLAGEFRRVQSRRPGYNEQRDGMKLEWDRLISTKTKKPYTNPAWVLRRFAELANAGWTVINRDKFIAHNFKRGYKVPMMLTPPHAMDAVDDGPGL